MDKWKYLATRMADGVFQDTLNQLGDQGWEVVSVERTEGETALDPAASPGGGYVRTPAGYRVLLKRRKQ
jgi:hypothetical protein